MRAVTDDPYFQMYYIPRYFYRRLFVQRAPKYQWQRRAVAVDHAWCCAPREKKRKKREEVEEEQEVEEEKVDEGNERGREQRTREASDRDYRRREREGGEGERKKNDRCINTARPKAYIYLCVASQCWAFVVLDDGRLSRETTSEAFASSSSSSSLSLLRPPPPPTPSFSSHTPALCVSPGLPSVCVSSLPNQFLPEWISRRGTRLSDP